MADITSIRAFFLRHQKKFGSVIVALLMFAAGWQLGRVMSPYYAAHPIVFSQAACEGCPDAGGSVAALEELQNEGLAAREPSPAVAAAVTTQAPAGEGTPLKATEGQYVASVNSDLYHHISCPSVKQIKTENQVWFATSEEAEAAGYTPSKCTQDRGVGE